MRWLEQLRNADPECSSAAATPPRASTTNCAFHLERQIAENIAAGMAPDEARYAALRTFGNPALLREQTRATWSWNWLESILRDLRYGIRTLRRTPGFSLIAITVMALCIGAATSLFTIVRSVLLRPLPFRDPGQPRHGVRALPRRLGKPEPQFDYNLVGARRLLRLARADPRLSRHGRLALVAVQPHRRAR